MGLSVCARISAWLVGEPAVEHRVDDEHAVVADDEAAGGGRRDAGRILGGGIVGKDGEHARGHLLGDEDDVGGRPHEIRIFRSARLRLSGAGEISEQKTAQRQEGAAKQERGGDGFHGCGMRVIQERQKASRSAFT